MGRSSRSALAAASVWKEAAERLAALRPQAEAGTVGQWLKEGGRSPGRLYEGLEGGADSRPPYHERRAHQRACRAGRTVDWPCCWKKPLQKQWYLLSCRSACHLRLTRRRSSPADIGVARQEPGDGSRLPPPLQLGHAWAPSPQARPGCRVSIASSSSGPVADTGDACQI